MGFIRQYIQQPQKLWLRKALFQIHLWLGLGIGLYIIAVGLTGSVLVFKEEAVASLVPKLPPTASVSGPQASISTVVANVQAAEPAGRVYLVSYPSEQTREFQAIVMRMAPGGGAKLMMSAHPVTGAIVGQVNLTKSWLGFMHNLHIVLLAGPAGFIANGIGAILLLVITATGMFLWWPGIKAWIRAFTVDFSKSWKRINFDLHNTMGFYTLLLVSFWSVSTVYFVWEEQFTAMVNKVSRVTLPDPHKPLVTVTPPPRGTKAMRANIAAMVEEAKTMVPGARVHAVSPGPRPDLPVVVFMSLGGAVEDPAEMPASATRVYFDPYSGKHLATQPAPKNQTIGDWIIWSMIPLHFGNKWGFTVKVIWALLGLSLPLLTITGALMFWNRKLSKTWKRITSGSKPNPPSKRESKPVEVETTV